MSQNPIERSRRQPSGLRVLLADVIAPEQRGSARERERRAVREARARARNREPTTPHVIDECAPRYGAQRKNDAWSQEGELTVEPRSASRDLVSARMIVRRHATD